MTRRRQKAWLSENCHLKMLVSFLILILLCLALEDEKQMSTMHIVSQEYILQEWMAKMCFCFGNKSSRWLNIASYLSSLFQLFMKMEYVVWKNCMNEVLIAIKCIHVMMVISIPLFIEHSDSIFCLYGVKYNRNFKIV